MRNLNTLGLAVLVLALSGCPQQSPTPPSSPSNSPQASPSPSASSGAQPTPLKSGVKRVAMFIPHEDLFWRDFAAFMEAASKQLEMKLEVHLANNNRELMKEQLRQATAGADRVDAVVFQNFKECGPDLLEIANQAGVPAFVVNAGVGESCGVPRGRYPHWIGNMESDGEAAGHALALLLIDEAKRRRLQGDDEKIHMIALAGIVSDASSNVRVQGLQRALKERQDVVLHQVVPTDWSQEEGRLKAQVLLKRFPKTAVVWAASDPLALGAIESVRALGRKPGAEVLLGGFDWTREALDAVRSGDLFVTIGGHFMEGGWVLVLLRDYLIGNDFAKKELNYLTPMSPITKGNLDDFAATLSAADWSKVEFRAMSNPAAGYSFDPNETLRALGKN